MHKKPTAAETLEREFLEIRYRLLDIAAAFDRIDRGDTRHAARSDLRMAQLHDALRILVDGGPDRVERVQMVFSETYDQTWRSR